ncbi:hypothetical protein [Desulfitobacterium chlororespirans]|uniref:Uncharacterized protein n=1 Tax=Desulfitobacterium chlororespirans DSM 11544 TaxID=1121395 RepID=A0A1M7SMI5_9FIRM|nr:hypothetical protein [Desulfitobacterium chlororespirans]SHN59686.1 hypothetical protein SAMN02745215_01085 [Desulfitobacterium chlororespirans DSM 11544]
MTARMDQINVVYSGSAVNKDLQIAEDFSKMAEFGYLDQEFTMYGAAYLGTDEQMKYLISSKRDEIYRFMAMSAYQGLCPTPASSYTEICPVPSGYEEDIALQVKFRLAKKLQQDYQKPLLAALRELAAVDGNDAAYELLVKEQEKVEDLYDRDILLVYEGLVDMAFKKKLLSLRSLNEFNRWINKIKKQMEDDLVVNDILEKTFYGYVYQGGDGTLKYRVNAQYESIYNFTLETEEQGCRPSPIFHKKYFYNYRYTLGEAKNDFNVFLKKLLNRDYMEIINALNRMPSPIDRVKFKNLSEHYRAQNDHKALETLGYYERRWFN